MLLFIEHLKLGHLKMVRNLFLTVLEAKKSQIKSPASGRDLPAVSSPGGGQRQEGKRANLLP
jgi:hypothetical protein